MQVRYRFACGHLVRSADLPELFQGCSATYYSKRYSITPEINLFYLIVCFFVWCCSQDRYTTFSSWFLRQQAKLAYVIHLQQRTKTSNRKDSRERRESGGKKKEQTKTKQEEEQEDSSFSLSVSVFLPSSHTGFFLSFFSIFCCCSSGDHLKKSQAHFHILGNCDDFGYFYFRNSFLQPDLAKFKS